MHCQQGTSGDTEVFFTNYSKHKRYNESCFLYIRNVAQYIFYDVYTIYGYTPTYDSEGED